MPRGPKGEKRPADVIGNAVHVMKILTGEIEDLSRRTRISSPRSYHALPGRHFDAGVCRNEATGRATRAVDLIETREHDLRDAEAARLA